MHSLRQCGNYLQLKYLS